MNNLAFPGRLFVGLAMVVFGVQQIVYLDFVTRVFPKLPPWVPGHSALACLFGLFLIVTGAAISIGKRARTAALALGAVILASFVVLYVPALIASPFNGGVWTFAGKGLALAGACFLVAGSLPGESKRGALDRLAPLGRFFLAAFLILAGALHFVYVEFVAALVPAWIPGHVFWTYFAGCALIAGGLGMIVPWTMRLAASLTALMIFLWVVLLHIPRAITSTNGPNETTAVFEALAMTGAAILVATSASASGPRTSPSA